MIDLFAFNCFQFENLNFSFLYHFFGKLFKIHHSRLYFESLYFFLLFSNQNSNSLRLNLLLLDFDLVIISYHLQINYFLLLLLVKHNFSQFSATAFIDQFQVLLSSWSSSSSTSFEMRQSVFWLVIIMIILLPKNWSE